MIMQLFLPESAQDGFKKSIKELQLNFSEGRKNMYVAYLLKVLLSEEQSSFKSTTFD